MIAPRFPVATQPSQRRVMPSVRGRSTLDGASGAVRNLAQRALLVPAFRALFAPFEVSGLEHLQAVDGPVIFAANHASHLDAPAVVAALPRARRRSLIVAAAEDYFYGSRVRRLLLNSTLSAYPFRRAGDPRWSLARTEELLASGRSVLLFPEGTRSPDGAIPSSGAASPWWRPAPACRSSRRTSTGLPRRYRRAPYARAAVRSGSRSVPHCASIQATRRLRLRRRSASACWQRLRRTG